MQFLRPHRTASVLAVLGTVGLLAGLLGRTRADEPPTGDLSPAEFTRLAGVLDLKKQPWAGIPWRVSVTEARRCAAEQGKPIFLVVNTGNCLGWT
jgi:hypothetical protein